MYLVIIVQKHDAIVLKRSRRGTERSINVSAKQCNSSNANYGDQRDQQAVFGQRGAFFFAGEQFADLLDERRHEQNP